MGKSGQSDFPPGFRFVPTDRELVYYLKRKEAGAPIPPYTVLDADIYQFSPGDLFGIYNLATDQEWYFFSSRRKKYRNGGRPDRAAGDGFWKATGSESPIKDNKGVTVGCKRSLVYKSGKATKTKTTWLMNEYELGDPKARGKKKKSTDYGMLDGWVLCKIYQKKGSGKELTETGQSQQADKELPNASSLPIQHVSNKRPYSEVPGDHMKKNEVNPLFPQTYNSAPKIVVREDPQPSNSTFLHGAYMEPLLNLDTMTQDEVDRFFLETNSAPKRVVRQDPQPSNNGYMDIFPDLDAMTMDEVMQYYHQISPAACREIGQPSEPQPISCGYTNRIDSDIGTTFNELLISSELPDPMNFEQTSANTGFNVPCNYDNALGAQNRELFLPMLIGHDDNINLYDHKIPNNNENWTNEFNDPTPLYAGSSTVNNYPPPLISQETDPETMNIENIAQSLASMPDNDIYNIGHEIDGLADEIS